MEVNHGLSIDITNGHDNIFCRTRKSSRNGWSTQPHRSNDNNIEDNGNSGDNKSDGNNDDSSRKTTQIMTSTAEQENNNNKNDDEVFVPYQILNQPIYHLCVKEEWEAAKRENSAYFPPTFVQDGRKTHASMDASDKLIKTANHFYKSSTTEWICLELNPNIFLELGIHTMVEEPEPVGTTAAPKKESTGTGKKRIYYPHIYGGIATTVPTLVTNTYPMIRDVNDGTFLSIPGLVEES